MIYREALRQVCARASIASEFTRRNNPLFLQVRL